MIGSDYNVGGVYCLNSCLAALQVALVVAQRRESGGRLSGIKLSALSIGLQRVAKMARKKKGKTPLYKGYLKVLSQSFQY